MEIRFVVERYPVEREHPGAPYAEQNKVMAQIVHDDEVVSAIPVFTGPVETEYVDPNIEADRMQATAEQWARHIAAVVMQAASATAPAESTGPDADLTLTAREFQQIEDALDAPAQVNPALARLLHQVKSTQVSDLVWDDCPNCGNHRPGALAANSASFLPGSRCPHCGHFETVSEIEEGDFTRVLTDTGRIEVLDEDGECVQAADLDDERWDAMAEPFGYTRAAVAAAVRARTNR